MKAMPLLYKFYDLERSLGSFNQLLRLGVIITTSIFFTPFKHDTTVIGLTALHFSSFNLHGYHLVFTLCCCPILKQSLLIMFLLATNLLHLEIGQDGHVTKYLLYFDPSLVLQIFCQVFIYLKSACKCSRSPVFKQSS